MPPQWKQYEPNPISPHHMGLLEKLSNSRPGDYNAPFNQALKEKQAIEAQQLNQQSVQMSLAEKQRQAAQEKAQAEALAAQFGTMDPNTPVDMNEVWDRVQRTAIKHNDIKTAMDIERATREKAGGEYILTGDLAKRAGVPDGTPMSAARLMESIEYRKDIQDRHDDPVKKQLREYKAALDYQKLTGTPVRPPTNAQEEELVGLNEIGSLAENITTRYSPHITENRAMRWAEAKLNPNSAISRIDNELTQLVFALAAARNGKRISDADFEYMAPLVKPQALDTIGTVLDKIDRVVEFAELRKIKLIETGESLGRNFGSLGTGKNSAPAIDIQAVPPPNFGAQQPDPNALAQQYAEQPNPQPTPQSTPTGAPVPQDRSGLTPEQRAKVEAIKARMTAGQGG